jgi:hypothetical protein
MLAKTYRPSVGISPPMSRSPKPRPGDELEDLLALAEDFVAMSDEQRRWTRRSRPELLAKASVVRGRRRLSVSLRRPSSGCAPPPLRRQRVEDLLLAGVSPRSRQVARSSASRLRRSAEWRRVRGLAPAHRSRTRRRQYCSNAAANFLRIAELSNSMADVPLRDHPVARPPTVR